MIVVEFVSQVDGDVKSLVFTKTIGVVTTLGICIRLVKLVIDSAILPRGDLRLAHRWDKIKEIADVDAQDQRVVQEALLDTQVEAVVGRASPCPTPRRPQPILPAVSCEDR